MPPPMSREQVREVDRRAIEEYGLPGVVLMENAGRGAAELLIRLGIDGTVVICAGKGNNGGDGFVIARHLQNHGVEVRLLLFCDPNQLLGDAAINYRVLRVAGMEGEIVADCPDIGLLQNRLTGADWIVDALLGTGTRGELREPFPTIISAINESSAKVFAIDLPSGMDCDSGEPLSCCVRAEHTATFVAPKLGFTNPAAAQFTGEVHVIDIGVPRPLITNIFKKSSKERP